MAHKQGVCDSACVHDYVYLSVYPWELPFVSEYCYVCFCRVVSIAMCVCVLCECVYVCLCVLCQGAYVCVCVVGAPQFM